MAVAHTHASQRVPEIWLLVLRLSGVWGRIKGRLGSLKRDRKPRLWHRPQSGVKRTGRADRKGDILGYARVSTADQEDRLRQAGAIRVFKDVISGRQFERPGLAQLIDHARAGDSLCATRLDRLGRSLKELLETVENLKARDIHLVSIEERIDTTRRRRTGVPCLRGDRSLRETAYLRAYARRYCGRQKARQAARSPGTRPGDHLDRANPCRGRIDGWIGRETTGYREGYGLQDHQGGTLKSRSWPMALE